LPAIRAAEPIGLPGCPLAYNRMISVIPPMLKALFPNAFAHPLARLAEG
jgi:hypothetical protein